MLLETVQYRPPLWAASLNHVPQNRVLLSQTPTPMHHWAPPGFNEFTEVSIKRDDRTGFALGGNKVRKLEFLLADALWSGADCVITCGGLQSNHYRATAVACRQLGLDSHLLLRTDKKEEDPGYVGNLLIERLAGAQLYLISPEQYAGRDALMAKVAERLKAQGRRPYIIPEGGSNEIGVWGYLETVNEIEEQAATEGVPYDDIVFACGSGGTAAGLSLGIALSGLPMKVHAVNVCNDAGHFYDRVNAIFGALNAPVKAEDVLDIVDGHVGLGYAKSKPEELAFIRDVATESGVVLDPVYTGKALYGLKHELDVAPDRFQGNHILFIHTGGALGLYDKIDEFKDLLGERKIERL